MGIPTTLDPKLDDNLKLILFHCLAMEKYFCLVVVYYFSSLFVACRSSFCDDLPHPKSYVAYKLGNGEKIEIDGKLDDDAWVKVASTDSFIDIQGAESPKPRFNTWAKIRWDDQFLYIGSYLEETDVFANQTKHDSVVFNDNDFEVFIDPDGSTHWYKEFEINAINTVWDLTLDKPYMNNGSPNSNFEMPTLKSAIYVDGLINKPSTPDKYWTVELAMPLKDLIINDSKASAPPKHGDHWRINFSRVEWHVKNIDGHYEKIPGLPEDNWVWSSQYAINMHLPERWGVLQFSTEEVNITKFVQDPDWPVYCNLVEIYNAEKKYSAIQGYYTSNMTQLDLPDYVIKDKCAQHPEITVTGIANFNATVKPLNSSLPVGHIRDDRLIWFTT